MKNALFLSALGLFISLAVPSYSSEPKSNVFLFRYGCNIDSRLPLSDLSDIIFDRLKTKYHWKKNNSINCGNGLCITRWHFTHRSFKYECIIKIKKSSGTKNMTEFTLEVKLIDFIGYYSNGNRRQLW